MQAIIQYLIISWSKQKNVFMFSYLYVDYGKARGKGFNGIISPNKKYIGGQRYENC